jgi:hypothetical protein
MKSKFQNTMIGLPDDKQDRKATPICTGVLDYFPAALAEVARVSLAGNEQHNPGQPLHWAKEKSQDEADALTRHLLARGTLDNDGVRHSAKLAWRALALLQRELEAEAGFTRDATQDYATRPGKVARGALSPRTQDAYEAGRKYANEPTQKNWDAYQNALLAAVSKKT